jgi:hypothetical protein
LYSFKSRLLRRVQAADVEGLAEHRGAVVDPDPGLGPLAAVAADMVHTAGALLASTAPLATQLYGTTTSAAGWVVSGMAAYRLLRGRADTGLIYLLLGGVFLTLAGALPDLSALARSQLPSGFGPVVTRAAITFTLGLGAAMVVAGLAGFRAPRRSQPAGVS